MPFGYLFYACPSQKCPVVLCYMDTWSDECLGFLRNSSSRFPGLCRLVLACSHDSLFLRYPAIDIVWRGPGFLALGFQRHLALRGSAWRSPSPYPVHLPDVGSALLTLTHAVTVSTTPPVVSALASTPYGCLVSAFLYLPHCLRLHRPVVSIDEELCGWQVLSPPSHMGTVMSDLRPCNPLAQSLRSSLRFHWTVVPLGDVRCGLRLFLSSCRNPSGRW